MTFTVTPTHPFLATDGQAIDLFPVASECTIAEAAQILDMSEVCVNELLEIGVLEFRQDGNRRLIRRDCLIEHDRHRKRVNKGLLEIIRLSEEMGLYDD
jgi:hypothetical protein